MTLLDIAAAAAAEHGIPALFSELRSASALLVEHGEALRRAHRAPKPWSPMAFFSAAWEPKEIARVEDELERGRRSLAIIATRLDAAIEAAGAACPALEIAARVERAISIAIEPPPEGGDGAFSTALHRIADVARRTWAPDIDITALVDRLAHHPTRLSAAERTLAPPRVDETLGWAPVGVDELTVRAARSLEASGFADALASLGKERLEYETMAQRLGAAREALTVGDALAFFTTTERQAEVQRLLTATLKEYEDAVVAAEVVLHALEQSVGEVPPLAIVVRANAALGALHAGRGSTEWYVCPEDGSVRMRPAAWRDAVVLAALVDLRRAVDAAFPGLSEIVSGRAALRREALTPGPYRMPSALGEPPPEPEIHGSEDAFFDALERWNLRPLIARALSHATMLGVLDHESPELVRRCGIKVDWESPGDEAERHTERRVARARWHRNVLASVGDAAAALVLEASKGEPRVLLHVRIIQAHHAIAALRIAPFGGRLNGRAQALAAVEALGAHLSQHFGPGGRRATLVGDVWAALRDGFVAPPRDQVVLTYPQIVARYAEALAANGPPRDLDALNQSMEAVWGLYPPAHAYYLLETVFDRVAAVHASSSTSSAGHTAYRVAGQDQAIAALTAWSLGVTKVFGVLPTASEIISRYVARELR